MRLPDVDAALYPFPSQRTPARKTENAKVVSPGFDRFDLSPDRS